MKITKLVVGILLGFMCSPLHAQFVGEANEPSPEALDAAFSNEDAARVAAGFSDELIAGPSGDPLEAMTGASDLVFRGTVRSQAYHYDIDGTPFTHTTFSIHDLIKGDPAVTEFTLVQPGGPAADNGDRLMVASDSQHFNMGEEELLFMNLQPDNPNAVMRASVESRFRIFEGRVYNEDGYGVILVALQHGKYQLDLSEVRSTAARFQQVRIGNRWLKKNFVEGEGRVRAGNAEARTPGSRGGITRGSTGPIQVHTFRAMILAAEG